MEQTRGAGIYFQNSTPDFSGSANIAVHDNNAMSYDEAYLTTGEFDENGLIIGTRFDSYGGGVYVAGGSISAGEFNFDGGNWATYSEEAMDFYSEQ